MRLGSRIPCEPYMCDCLRKVRRLRTLLTMSLFCCQSIHVKRPLLALAECVWINRSSNERTCVMSNFDSILCFVSCFMEHSAESHWLPWSTKNFQWIFTHSVFGSWYTGYSIGLFLIFNPCNALPAEGDKRCSVIGSNTSTSVIHLHFMLFLRLAIRLLPLQPLSSCLGCAVRWNLNGTRSKGYKSQETE